jgi:two-component system cell cycle response regulator
MMDLDHFKRVNDTYGHHIGDRILEGVGHTILDFIRKTDTACRYGGEEFVLLMPGTDLDNAFAVAERIRRAMSEEYFQVEGERSISVTLSMGISGLKPGDGVDSLMERADRGLYEAKRKGRNRTVVMT